MKITVLLENTSLSCDIFAEHGLSLFIETEEHNVLFDMGQSPAFAENAEKLGVDLKSADLAVLSHGHYDHGGGLARFLEINDHAPVYISRRAFGNHYHGPEKYIGIDKALQSSQRLIYVDDECKIDGDFSLHGKNNAPLLHPIESFGLSMVKNGVHFPDTFAHEQYLLIKEGEKKVLISGCAHKGVVNIARWFKPDVVVGGFHLSKLSPEDPEERARLENICNELLDIPAIYYTGHCTGKPVFDFMKGFMGERLQGLSGGLIFEV